MKPRMTKWISGKLKPTLPGVYERDIPDTFYGNFSYFDGEVWGVSSGSPELAKSNQVLSSVWQDLKWRGLAEDPSAAKAASHDTKGPQ